LKFFAPNGPWFLPPVHSRAAGSAGRVGRELGRVGLGEVGGAADVEPRVARLLEAMLEGMLA
jgi:hypothetical protein